MFSIRHLIKLERRMKFSRCLCSLNQIAPGHGPRLRRYLEKLVKEHSTLESDAMSEVPSERAVARLHEISTPANLSKQLMTVEKDMAELDSMLESENDESMTTLLKDERVQLNGTKHSLMDAIIDSLMPMEIDDICEVTLEVHAGVGGTEAGLFAAEMFRMYKGFCQYRGWSMGAIEWIPMTEAGGDQSMLKAVTTISGEGVYNLMKFESGVHRVQRSPLTDRSGRIHTSTVVVVVLPTPRNITIDIQPKDLKIDTFRASGGGGQHVNKTSSAVRITHLPTGMAVECQETRSQHQNRAKALSNLQSRLYEQQLTAQQTKTSTMRKLQIGGANRNEKIRTYNFPQDRVTDHRVKLSVNSIRDFMTGDESFEEFLTELISIDRRDQLSRLLDDMETSGS